MWFCCNCALLVFACTSEKTLCVIVFVHNFEPNQSLTVSLLKTRGPVCKVEIWRHLAAQTEPRLHYHLFQDLTAEVLANELKLSILVKGGAMVEGPMGIRIRVGLECTLHCEIDKLFQPEARHEVVQSKECKYSYF